MHTNTQSKTNWVKTNWFKLGILIFLIFIAVIFYEIFSSNVQQNLSQAQEKCRDAGFKNDQEANDIASNYNPTTVSKGYYYNSELGTCLEAYSYNFDKNSTPTITNESWKTGVAIKDLYNNDDILSCDDTSADFKLGIDGIITEDKNGIGIGKDLVTKYSMDEDSEFWNECNNLSIELSGGEFGFPSH